MFPTKLTIADRSVCDREIWSAPAERSGDGALV